MILALITLGKMLEARSKGKTTDALKSLMKLAPKNRNGRKKRRGNDRADRAGRKGRRVPRAPRRNIPVDGMVIDGSSAVDESTLTGESIPR